MLKYGISVKNFTCPDCGQFSDEVSQITDNIMDDSIMVACCDSEFWAYDLKEMGFEVLETIHGGTPAIW